MKRVALMFAIAAAFLIGEGVAVKAWPGVDDRSAHYGYFLNKFDDWGDSVISTGIPSYIDNAEEYISYMRTQLYSGTAQNRIGANFVVDYMLGGPPWRRDRVGTAQFDNIDFPLWVAHVRAAQAEGRVNWFQNFTFTGNSYYQGTDAGSNPQDDAFYYENDTSQSVVFRNPDGSIASVIKRICSNIVTSGYMPGFKDNYSVSGRTTVSTPQGGGVAVPLDTVTYRHYVKNNGPTAAPYEYWTALDGPSGVATGLGNPSGGPMFMNPGQENNVRNENFTIPNGAPPNRKYCRLVGWDPVNSGGARNGRGTEACVTVVIPAKLKAVMVADPRNIIAGDTVQFTPSITTVSSGNPVTVNCTITRVLTSPSGATTNLGNQQCVDSAGNTDIVVNTGATVTLKSNSYSASDTLAVGTKVCDTINITNPTNPNYFNSAADRTATDCAIVAKTPYARFMGNDVFAGGNFAAIDPACNTQSKITTLGRTLSDGSTAGSVGEYGVFALGKITGFGSAGKVLVGSGGLGGPGRGLTFANSEPDATKLGYFGAAQHCITDYTAQFGGSPAIAGGAAFDVAARPAGAWHVTGTLSLSGTMPQGDLSGGQQVYYADSDVTITGDIKYPTSYAAVNKIPSLIVITKGNIYIAPGVKQLDGIFVARGDGNTTGIFYTCWPKNEPASVNNQCNNNQLVVNGSVSAARLDLFRSFGATGATSDARKDPGEIFNFAPEMYMRNAINANGQTTVQTSTTLELPPRF